MLWYMVWVWSMIVAPEGGYINWDKIIKKVDWRMFVMMRGMDIEKRLRRKDYMEVSQL